MPETLRRTNLGALCTDSRVNLERALAADGRFGGHIVSGHIDGTGTIRTVRREENAVWITVEAAPDVLNLIVEKGSVAIDGVSLTVAGLTEQSFRVSLIPIPAYTRPFSQRKQAIRSIWKMISSEIRAKADHRTCTCTAAGKQDHRRFSAGTWVLKSIPILW